MAELEKRLVELGGQLDLPAGRGLAERVGADLRAGVERNRRIGTASLRRRSMPRLRLVGLVLLATLLLAAGAVAAVPSARHAVLEFLGLRGETIERVPKLPENVRAKPGWKLGRPTTLAAARRGLVFDPLLPSGIEGPNGVFLDPSILGGALNLTYPPQPRLPRSRLTGVGLLVDELEGQAAPGYYGKMVPPGARIERFRLGGQFAVWIEGLHAFFYKPHADFTFHSDHSRLAANALVVQHGDVMVRLEGKFDKATALAIARSLHG
ncbi:MAG TPA: hypothetical protein VN522_02825 [Solirubrobacterales bacterium]|nr:hypothetical protein [Solirubrobacterales bacterium]